MLVRPRKARVVNRGGSEPGALITRGTAGIPQSSIAEQTYPIPPASRQQRVSYFGADVRRWFVKAARYAVVFVPHSRPSSCARSRKVLGDGGKSPGGCGKIAREFWSRLFSSHNERTVSGEIRTRKSKRIGAGVIVAQVESMGSYMSRCEAYSHARLQKAPPIEHRG